MDSTRFILLLAVGLVLMMLIQAWQEDYGTKPQTVSESTESETPAAPQSVDVPQAPAAGDVPVEAPTAAAAPDAAAGLVRVKTDVYELHINLRGGGIDKLHLLQFPQDTQNPDAPVTLMQREPGEFYIIQGGLLSETDSPTHDAIYSSPKSAYALSDGEDSLLVALNWQSPAGIKVTKSYRFHRGSYLITVDYKVTNNSGQAWSGRAYGQLQRNDPGREGRRLLYTYTGAILSTPEERYRKIDFDDMEDKPLELSVTDGWAAMLQHYFVSALIPAQREAAYYYYTKALPEANRYMIGMMSPAVNVAAGNSASLSHKLFIGPKDQDLLEQAAPRLELTVDYGSLWFIAKPLFICLDWFHGITANWGFAIILVTLLIKIIFYPLSAAGYRSMANMRKVQPRLLAIRDRYKDDKARLNQAMMDLYKTEKINPLGGCFPILIQIPVFIALYWVLLESVELRQANFMLWIHDLSSPDPWYVLPVLMGISMFIQQKLNPAPMDPVQEKVMMTLPFVFTVFFAFFPSGLVLYWVVNNVLSIAQQWMITRQIEAAGT